MASLCLEAVGKTYPGGVAAVEAVSLAVGARELVVLVGPSGCGKSTVLRLVAGLEEPTSGRIRLGEREITRTPPGDRNIAMVFQNYALYPFKTVYENLAFALRLRRVARAEVDRLVREVANRLDLSDLLQRYPTKLSGGQQQRVALGRALVRRPDLFLFDEPLSNLDLHLRRDLRQEIKRLQRESATAGVYVTHDQEEAMSLADRLVVMRSGRFLQVGAPREIYSNPANRFVAGFFGSPPMNFLEGEVHDRAGKLVWERPGGAPLSLEPFRSGPLGGPLGQRVCLGFRPEALQPGSAAGGLTLRVRVGVMELLGDHTDVPLVTGAGERITARLRTAPAVAEGEEIDVSVPAGAFYWFRTGPEGERISWRRTVG